MLFSYAICSNAAAPFLVTNQYCNLNQNQIKSQLLSAELHYLNGDLGAAEIAYKKSIASAHSHKFLHEEALAYELYGVFLIENKFIDRGKILLELIWYHQKIEEKSHKNVLFTV